MGTDVILAIERRGPDGWALVGEPEEIDRNSDLSEILRSVPLTESSEVPGIVPDPWKGVPSDASPGFRHAFWTFYCPHDDPPPWEEFVQDPSGPYCSCLGAGSYLTVRELLAYDWNQTVRWTPRVADRDDGRFRDGGRAGHIQREADATGRYDSWDSPGAHLRWGEAVDSETHIEIDVPVGDLIYADFFLVVLAMARMAGGDLDSVRCVFYFFW
ncbi:hypothetical protein [Actinomadura sp. 9N407]|uniref:hypothetical protein n=1 Tax=Actinomadura sp. 9N407 TaxID=3375154 RepID=UPI0037A7C1D9